jgi:2-deoxy-D-gluconate 3-dehydrogenase
VPDAGPAAETLAQIDDGRELILDFTDPMAARGVFADEKIDILVNNAGIIRRSRRNRFQRKRLG